MPEVAKNPIFKDCVVAIAGDLNDYAWREEQVRKWVHYWGGMFSYIVDASVTHLLCTGENFGKKTAAVRVALRSKDTKIVLRDWLEDSINKKVCLRTSQYELREKAKEENAKKRKLEKRAKCSRNAENYVDERFWHVYRDCTYFEYQIQLKRNDEESGNVGEKHLLTLWQSNAKPYNYQCTTLFTKKSKNRAFRDTLNKTPVDFITAFESFQNFFMKKTGIAWDDRIEKMGSTGPDYFQYQPPSGGKPLGLINGRPASIFDSGGDSSHINASDQIEEEEVAEEAQHDDDLMEVNNPPKTSRKHAREEHETDDAGINAYDEGSYEKRPRYEGPEAVSARQATTDHMDLDPESDSDGAQSTQRLRRARANGWDVIEIPDPSAVGLVAPPNTPAEGCEPETSSDESRSPSPIPNDDETAQALEQMYDEAEDEAMYKLSSLQDEDESEEEGEAEEEYEAEDEDEDEAEDEDENEDEDEGGGEEASNAAPDTDTDTDDDAARQAPLTPAIEAEAARGVHVVRNSQAALIDQVRAQRMYASQRQRRAREEEARQSPDEDSSEEERRRPGCC
ncbi:hypothetical protein GGS24DRAFT_114144 [Hypoxylon argillaceum]|nr:hypothetical protein GGS24DRAFT_114144 [Hypoxylon argillaceum]